MNWIDLDPLPFQCKQLACILTTDGFVPNQARFFEVDLTDENSVARAFQQANMQNHVEFMSPQVKMPPDAIRNVHNSLVYFKIPKSMLEKKLRLFLLASSDATLGKHAMPNTIIGSTDTLDQDLKFILQ